MLLARKGPDSDVFVVANPESNKFYCIRRDPGQNRIWEPPVAMTGNEMYQYLKKRKELGDKVPDSAIVQCLTLQMR